MQKDTIGKNNSGKDLESENPEQYQAEKLGFKRVDKVGNFTIPRWWDCGWRRVACGQDDCKVCGRINRDRKRHILAGEDPDSIENHMADVALTLSETLEMLKNDMSAQEIEIAEIDRAEESPDPEIFPVHTETKEWHQAISELLEDAQNTRSLWICTEAAEDLAWYKNTLLTKTYRQLGNRSELDNGEEVARVDYEYTGYALTECFKIIKKSLSELSTLNSPQKGELIVSLAHLIDLERQVLTI